MRTKLLICALLVTIAAISIFISCKKNDASDGTARLQVFLTDDPGDYEAVYIDVKDVQINVTGDDVNGWQSMKSVNAGVYDLLRLVNDEDTILADAEIPSGRLHQIRLVLGTENYVKIEGTSQLIKLETPSAEQSGLKLNVQYDVTDERLYMIVLDFDVAKSIVKTGSSKYILKPTIRAILNAVGGSVKGVVMPNDFQTAVYAVQGVDTIATTFTGANGGYIIKGLPAGSYDVFYRPSSIDYRDSLRKGISVMFNVTTRVDTTFLRHQ